MQDDNRETEIEIKKLKILSNWDKEEIFIVRWITWIISITIIILFSFPRDKPENALLIMIWCLLFWTIPIFIYFRKWFRKEIREKASWYWDTLKGRK